MGDLTDLRDLLEFSFESRVAPDIPDAALHRLARLSAAYNGRMGLTGCLRFDGGRISQTIEGLPALLLPLAGRILADTRHREIRVIAFRASVRRFRDWTTVGLDHGPKDVDAATVALMPTRIEQRPRISASIHSLVSRSPLSALPDA